jgi:oxygen-independent coproporphyrinogen III oxidase
VTIRHLYVHVPFCLRRCGYCDFAVTATRAAPVRAWLDCVAAELALRARLDGWAEPLRLDTIYVGGGTPSLLGTGAMGALAKVLRRHAVWDDGVEWTCEANPESFDPALAVDWVAAGVNRVSLGAQTFHEPTLRWMGRLHGADGPARALRAAREAGLDNVSIDLIFGVPSRLGRDWGGDLDRAAALEPAHVSLYGLTAEAGTPLGRWVEVGREHLANEDRYAAEYLLAAERLAAGGFEHYEVSNFAQPGRASRHNRAYWEHRPYVGIGPGAHSFLPPVRSWNVRDWAEYRQRLDTGEAVQQDREVLGEEALALETAWLGLRSDGGLPLAGLSQAQRDRVGAWAAAGWAKAAENEGSGGASVRLTAAGWLLLDRLAVELESASGRGSG